ncbi:MULTISPECIES: mechanosensitive ion channel family protein [Acidiplasma]|uniref:Mechanosensitive ion channel protein MscS n=1 Tax=Acidiplasma aeolicum TaxID=507754 RepID=A0A0P9CKJ2_9ARCH|nr:MULTISPECIES: mechanosensitive ion channel family protein [Acidiplasma]KPV45867.1 mechanosensitive ion channel protein MscS [Acidiplasma aeolicum]
MNRRGLIASIIVVIISMVIIIPVLFILDTIYHIPFFESYNIFLYAITIVAGGIIIVNLIASLIMNRATRAIGKSTAGTLSFTVKIVGYLIIIIIFFTFVKIDIGAALAAGGFAGLVLGLASQDVLSNIFGGIAVVASHPFRVGDRVTVSTWQYGLDAPAYPPKFYSNDFLIPGYTGVITDISLMYTSILTDDNVPLKIPNSIMIQAAVFIQGKNNSRLVRTKFEISKDIDPDIIIPILQDGIKNFKFILNEPEIRIYETTFTTYIIVIEAMCSGNFEEPPRSEILKFCMKTVRSIKTKQN